MSDDAEPLWPVLAEFFQQLADHPEEYPVSDENTFTALPGDRVTVTGGFGLSSFIGLPATVVEADLTQRLDGIDHPFLVRFDDGNEGYASDLEWLGTDDDEEAPADEDEEPSFPIDVDRAQGITEAIGFIGADSTVADLVALSEYLLGH